MSRLAITGAGGYLGGRLALGAGCDVVPIVHRPTPWLHGVGIAESAVLDLAAPSSVDALSELLDGCDAVVHLAGRNEVAAATDPEGALVDTVVATRHLALAAAATATRVVYVSTVHVYGAALAPGAVVDEQVVPEPRADYAIARLASEHELGASGVDHVVLRLTNAVGPPADPAVERWTLLVNDLCRQVVRTGRMALRSDGTQWRDFVDLDAVLAVIAAAADPAQLAAGRYNLAAGRSATVREVAGLVADAFESATGERPPLDAPAPSGPPPEAYRVDASRLAAAIEPALVPGAAIGPAVAATVGFCLAHADVLRATA